MNKLEVLTALYEEEEKDSLLKQTDPFNIVPDCHILNCLQCQSTQIPMAYCNYGTIPVGLTEKKFLLICADCRRTEGAKAKQESRWDYGPPKFQKRVKKIKVFPRKWLQNVNLKKIKTDYQNK